MIEIEVPGGRVVATDQGSGEVVVLHPSLGRPAADFDDLARRLASGGFRALAIDPRGIGASTGSLDELSLEDCALDVALVAAHADVARVHLVGHAFGNRVVRLLATIRPDLVLTVTLLGAGGRFEGDPTAREALLRCFGPAEPADEHLNAVRTAFFAPGSDATVWSGGWHAEAAAAQGRAARSRPVDEWWNGGTAPMLVVQGLNDRVAPPENGRALARDRPDVTLVELENAGHALLPEQPDAVATAVIDFLQSNATDPSTGRRRAR